MTGDEYAERSRGDLATHRSPYRRLASAIGLAPLRIPVSLILVTVAAWVLMLHHALNMSAPMGSAVPGAMDVPMTVDNSLGGLGVFLTVWTVMMGAMMLPSAAPMILTFAASQGSTRSQGCRPHLDVRRGLPSGLGLCGSRRLCPSPDWPPD